MTLVGASGEWSRVRVYIEFWVQGAGDGYIVYWVSYPINDIKPINDNNQ